MGFTIPHFLPHTITQSFPAINSMYRTQSHNTELTTHTSIRLLTLTSIVLCIIGRHIGRPLLVHHILKMADTKVRPLLFQHPLYSQPIPQSSELGYIGCKDDRILGVSRFHILPPHPFLQINLSNRNLTTHIP